MRHRRGRMGRELDDVSISDESLAVSEVPATPKAADTRNATREGGGKTSARPDVRARSPGADSVDQHRLPSISGRKPTPQRRLSDVPGGNRSWVESAEFYYCGETGHLQMNCPVRPATPLGRRSQSQRAKADRRGRGRSLTPTGRQPNSQEVRPNPAVESSAQSGGRGGGSGPEVPQPRAR